MKHKTGKDQVIVGNYDLGPESVQLVLRGGSGADFYMNPGDGCSARIKIGMDGHNQHEWGGIVGMLLHEALELSMTRMGLRYTPVPDYSFDNGQYLFAMTHTQFSEASARAAMFMASALPDFASARKKWIKMNKT